MQEKNDQEYIFCNIIDLKRRIAYYENMKVIYWMICKIICDEVLIINDLIE